MVDSKSARESADGAARTRPRLPRVDDPPTPAPSAPPAPSLATPATAAKQVRQLDVAEQFIHDAIRDGATLDFQFLDGKSSRGQPVAIGLDSIKVRTDDGTEAVVFKHALRMIRPLPPKRAKRPVRRLHE
jgi:hypothetical protein